MGASACDRCSVPTYTGRLFTVVSGPDTVLRYCLSCKAAWDDACREALRQRATVEGTVTWTSRSVAAREPDVVPDGQGRDCSLLRRLEPFVGRRVRVTVEPLPEAPEGDRHDTR